LTRKVPWVIKYRPRRVEEVVGQDDAKRVLREWLAQWAKGRVPEKRAALLYGPPGVGKTSLVEALARELDFELVELNASDYRRKSDIERIVGVAARRRPLLKKGMIILMDEVDGIDPKADEGGLEALLSIIRETSNPIVFTANDPWKEQLKPLRNECLMVEFKELTEGQIVALLQRICDAEGIYCEREALRYIAEKSMGDARAAINDLEAVAEGYGKVTLGLARAIVRGRDKSLNIWRTLSGIFYAKQAWMAKRAVTQSEEDYETLIAWLNDNIPRKYTDPYDLFRAYEALARATVQLSRAKVTGEWSLLSYVFDLIGPGIALARTSGEVSKATYSYPDRIKLMAQLKSVRDVRERIAELLARSILASKATVKNEVIPYLMIIFRNEKDPTMAARLALGYRLDKEMVKFLAGPNAENVIKTMEKIKRARPEEVKEAKVEEKPKARKAEEGAPKRREKTGRETGGLDRFLKR